MAYHNEEEEADREELSDEEREIEDAWRDQVVNVLSHTRIDPKSKGNQFEWFLKYEGQVTPEQIKALKLSHYGQAFHTFIRHWKRLPEDSRGYLGSVAEFFAQCAVITHGPYNQLRHLEKAKEEPLSELQVLRQAQWLETYFWDEGSWDFDSRELGSQLSYYIELGMEWPYLERQLLKCCIHRAAKEQHRKIVAPFRKSPGAYLAGRLSGFIVPVLMTIGIDAAIAIWSLARLSGEHKSVWAIVGLAFVAFTIAVSIVHYGTSEVRRLLQKLLDPRWDPYDPKINRDLEMLHRTVNGYPDPHLNLRLVREQLVRLQATDIHIPVQFLTLLDRAIAKGVHSW